MQQLTAIRDEVEALRREILESSRCANPEDSDSKGKPGPPQPPPK